MKVVLGTDIKKAAEIYQNSAKEEEDIIREFVVGNGSLTHLLNHIPFMRVEDQPRILLIIEELVKAKKIPKEIKLKKIKH